MSLIGFLINPNTRDSDINAQEQDARTAARTFGKDIVALKTSSDQDFDAAFATMVERGAGAFLHASDSIFLIRRAKIVALAARHALPGIYTTREFAVDGGLMSYGDDVTDSFRQVGIYVARILKGAKPAELPVVQPAKFQLVINAKAGKALSLTIPFELLARADEVIE